MHRFSGGSSSYVAGKSQAQDFQIGFSPTFAGPKKLFVLAANADGHSGWLERGTWAAPNAPEPGILKIYPPVAAIN